MKIHLALVPMVFLASGCTNFGPGTVERDRFDYNTAISESSKEQMLLNIVKIRYADIPVFVQVTSIIGAYTFEGSVSAGTILSRDSLTGDSVALSAGGKFVDRPTITYVPLAGEEFAKAFLTPIRPSTILFLMQAGWPVDRLFPLTVDSIGGFRGVGSFVGSQDDGDPKYYQVVRLLRKIQLSNAFGMQIERTESNAETSVLLFHRERVAPDILAAMAELREILGLRPGLEKIKVRFGSVAKDDTEIAMTTRSMMHMMIALSRQIDVPIEDIEAGRTLPTINLPDIDSDDLRRLIQISHGTERPADAFTAVKYRGRWFWIDDRDFRSKRTLAFLLILFSLTETGGEVGLPLVTIPAG